MRRCVVSGLDVMGPLPKSVSFLGTMVLQHDIQEITVSKVGG